MNINFHLLVSEYYELKHYNGSFTQILGVARRGWSPLVCKSWGQGGQQIDWYDGKYISTLLYRECSGTSR